MSKCTNINYVTSPVLWVSIDIDGLPSGDGVSGVCAFTDLYHI